MSGVVDPNSEEAARRRAALSASSLTSEEFARRKARLARWLWALGAAASATVLLALFAQPLALGYVTMMTGALALPIAWWMLRGALEPLFGKGNDWPAVDPITSVTLSSALFIVLALTRPELAETLGGMIWGAMFGVAATLAVVGWIARRFD